MATRRTTSRSKALLAAALLDAVLAAPAVPYQGHMMITQWYGKTRTGQTRTRAEEMIVRVLPPDRVRREYLALDGAVERVSISDGELESVHLVRSGKTVVGDAVGRYEKVLPSNVERETLLSNYELAASTGDRVAGRATWKLTLKPKVSGKAWQAFWLDQETKIVLRTKRYQPRRAFASQAQFMSFEAGKPQDAALFHVADSSAGTISPRSLAPDFLTLEQLGAATGRPVKLPSRLPGGFIFESADVFPVESPGVFSVRKSTVSHVRYTDGLIVLSVFETDRPVRLPEGGAISTDNIPLPGPLRASLAGKVLPWKVGRRHYTMMGDVPKELMAQIAQTLR